MRRRAFKAFCMNVVQYIALFAVYLIIGTALTYVTDSLFINSNNQISLVIETIILTLLAFFAIMTKPTPLAVILFGGITYIGLGNGMFGNFFFMALFPVIYFVEKKGLYKSKKSLILIFLICNVLLLLDTLYLWVQYHEINCCPFSMGISVLLAFEYAAHKPRMIRKWFPVTEEIREARKIALSTRIIAAFGVISVIVFLADLYSFDIDQRQKEITQETHFNSRIEGDVSAILRDSPFSEETARLILDLVGRNCEGIICYDLKNDKYIEAYQKDVPESLNRDAFQLQIRSILQGDEEDTDMLIAHNGYAYSLSHFNVNGETDASASEWQYVVLMVQFEGRMVVGNLTGVGRSFYRLFILLCMLLPTFFWLIEFMITKPINSMTALVSRYVYSSEEQRKELEKQFAELDIHTGDEIENLFHAFAKTILDMNAYIDDLHMKTEQITKMQFSMVSTLANVVENRDKCTGDHIKRTAEYVETIGTELSKIDKYKEVLTPKYIYDMKIAAQLHDIGKIQVSDTILNKPGKLDEEEYAIMKTHSAEGKRILQETIREFGEFDYLLMAVDMAGYHHERYDGKGYPEGLVGEEIPLCARIMAVADVFDALVSKRSYKQSMSLDQAFNIIEEGKGTQFDGDVVDAFFAAQEQIEKLYKELA